MRTALWWMVARYPNHFSHLVRPSPYLNINVLYGKMGKKR